MDDKIRKLERLAAAGDEEAQQELIILRAKIGQSTYGLRAEWRLYRCRGCGETSNISTNHTGPCYSHCKNCSWKGMIIDDKVCHPGMRPYDYVGPAEFNFRRNPQRTCASCRELKPHYSHKLCYLCYRELQCRWLNDIDDWAIYTLEKPQCQRIMYKMGFCKKHWKRIQQTERERKNREKRQRRRQGNLRRYCRNPTTCWWAENGRHWTNCLKRSVSGKGLCREHLDGFEAREMVRKLRERKQKFTSWFRYNPGGKESRRRRARRCPDCGIQRSLFKSDTHPRGWYGYHGYCIVCHSRRANMGTCLKCEPPKLIRYQLLCQCGRSDISDDLQQPCPACGEEMQIYDPDSEKKRQKRARDWGRE